MIYEECFIKGVWVITPRQYSDARGVFMETYKKAEFDATIGEVNFVQDNCSISSRGVLRGLHYQKGASSQAKLVSVLRGAILDVVVDMRCGSPTLGKHVAVELNEQNRKMLFVPRGFAHGFVALHDHTVVCYKVDNPYSPKDEACLRFDEPLLKIDWRLEKEEIILSPKDAEGTSWNEAYCYE